MLAIRNIQLDVLREQRRQDFISRMVGYAREAYPVLCQPQEDTELAALMAGCMDRAIGYQLITETQVIRFLDLLLTFGTDVDSAPRFERITRILRREHGKGRPAVLRLNEVSRTLHAIARRHPEILLAQLGPAAVDT
jgi:hypothetical protein